MADSDWSRSACALWEAGIGGNKSHLQVKTIDWKKKKTSNFFFFFCQLLFTTSPRSAALSWLPGSILFVGNIYAGSRALSSIVRPPPATFHRRRPERRWRLIVFALSFRTSRCSSRCRTPPTSWAAWSRRPSTVRCALAPGRLSRCITHLLHPNHRLFFIAEAATAELDQVSGRKSGCVSNVS